MSIDFCLAVANASRVYSVLQVFHSVPATEYTRDAYAPVLSRPSRYDRGVVMRSVVAE
jgi:hypothetical protein